MGGESRGECKSCGDYFVNPVDGVELCIDCYTDDVLAIEYETLDLAELKEISYVASLTVGRIREAGYEDLGDVARKGPNSLEEVVGVSGRMVDEIFE